MAVTYAQLADLLRSGVPLLRSLEVLKNQTSHAGLKSVLDDVYSAVEEGTTLADAMQRHPRAFSEMAVSMVRAGGEGGFLEDALGRVAQVHRTTGRFEEPHQRSVGVPSFLAIVGVTVVSVLIIFFVPKFEDLFARLARAGRIAALDRVAVGNQPHAGRWLWLIVLVAGVGFVYARNTLQTEEGRQWSDRMKLKVPLAGKIFQNSGRGPVLPRVRHVAAQRRADFAIVGNQQRRGRQSRA